MSQEAEAARARDLYCRQVRLWKLRQEGVESDYGARPIAAWDGGQDSAGRQHRPVWARLAAFCQRAEVDLANYLYACFRWSFHHPPSPYQLMTEAFLARYHAQGGDRLAVTDLTVALRTQHQVYASAVALRSARLERGWTMLQVIHDVLLDRDLEMSALYRYCVAATDWHPEHRAILEEFEDEARAQYERQPAVYLRAWGSFLPPGLARVRALPADLEPAPVPPAARRPAASRILDLD